MDEEIISFFGALVVTKVEDFFLPLHRRDPDEETNYSFTFSDYHDTALLGTEAEDISSPLHLRDLDQETNYSFTFSDDHQSLMALLGTEAEEFCLPLHHQDPDEETNYSSSFSYDHQSLTVLPGRAADPYHFDPVNDLPIFLQSDFGDVDDEELDDSRNDVVFQPRWGSLGPYSGSQRILLVGEGDFSFSASLAVAFGDASNMVATSLDSFEFLTENYNRALTNIVELKSRRCKVIHGVDATKMADHPQLRFLKFDCVVYNFPHAGFSNRYGPRDAQIREHQKLVRGFLANAKKMIQIYGQIHITHKCHGFFLDWNLEMLGSLEGLRLVEEAPFDFRDYPGYRTKRGDGSDLNFNCDPSKTYKFQLA